MKPQGFMKINYVNNFKSTVAILAVISAVCLLAADAQANWVLDLSAATYFSGTTNPSASQIASVCGINSSQVGSLLCQFRSNGKQDGLLKYSYTPSPSLTKINYGGGDLAGATCLIVKCGDEGSYVWNLSGWNGTDPIDCRITQKQMECDIYGNCKLTNHVVGSVMEPSTIVASILLLLPFGISAVRIMRRHKVEPSLAFAFHSHSNRHDVGGYPNFH